MIASITGTVIAVMPTQITVDVGGVGLAIRPSGQVLQNAKVGQQISLATQLLIRDDELTLFGFVDLSEREVFEALQKVSGVGPKSAMHIVSALGVGKIQKAITEGDAKVLTNAPGVGNKLAQRIVLELAGSFVVKSLAIDATEIDQWASVQSALLNLGWSDREAREAITAARADAVGADTSAQDVGERLKLALSFIGRR